MGFLSKLKAVLVGSRDRSPEGGTTVTVEREPDAGTERAVKESPPPEAEPDADPVESVKGIGPAYGDRLAAVGVETVADLADADPADLAERTDLSETRLRTWIERAREG
ncbi:MAG: helix-hairpin-helix domain-containing protein [Halobacteriales archaeon]